MIGQKRLFFLTLIVFCLPLIDSVAQTPPPTTAPNDRTPPIVEEELQGPSVRFRNRNNLLATPASRTIDINDGKALAGALLKNGEAGNKEIRIKRVFSPDEDGFGADIIMILPKTNIGHINSVNRILAGYLAEAFEFNEKDGMVMGRIILDYNARNRARAATLKKYSPSVSRSVQLKKMGIALSYRQWPGRTMILVPLRKNIVRPGKSDLDGKEISKDTKVSDKDKQKSTEIQQKRNIEDNRRLDKKENELNQEKAEIAKKETALKETQKKVSEKIQQNQKTIQETKNVPGKEKENKDAVQKQTELKKEEKRINEEIKKTEEQKKQNEEQQKEVTQQRKENEQQQIAASESGKSEKSSEASATPPDNSSTTNATVKQLQDENQALKQKIEQQNKQSPNVVDNKILFLRVIKYIQGGHYHNELWQLDPVKDDALRKGPFSSICGKEFLIVPDQGILVIGYEGENHTDDHHHLILLDKENLEYKKGTRENIFWRSPLMLRDNKIYTFEIKDGLYYLSRFSPDLTFEARTSEPVNPDSDITFFNEKVYVTGKGQDNGGYTSIKVFKRDDLTHLKSFEPK